MAPLPSHSVLGNGEQLLTGNSLFSPDGTVEFKMQVDGKIAIYHGSVIQFQNTPNQSTTVKGITMQPDGNLVLYDNNGTALWLTGTQAPLGDNHTICAVQNDGNVVIYKGTPIWSSKTPKK